MTTSTITSPVVEPKGLPAAHLQRTQSEITTLFNAWKADPCFDLEDADGFEAHREQLLGMRREHEERCARQARQLLVNKAIAIGVPGNLTLAAYLVSLEDRIQQLESICQA